MTTDKFKELVKVYSGMTIEFPHLKPITVAQWLLETGRGDSFLCREHNNFGGMMWRAEMTTWPLSVFKVRYTSPSDGIDTYYASFTTLEDWVKGYWKFIDRAVYAGWREHCQTGYEYISWLKKCGYAADPDYVTKVFALLPEANQLLSNIKDDTHSDGETPMPKVDIVKNSPNKSARGATITHLVLHNTAGGFNGSVDWLCNPSAGASAHLVISRSGQTAQLVPFAEKAWHAGNANPNSIGIEIEATNSQRGMTEAQEAKVIEWCRYLMAQYKIKPQNVIIHRMVNNTDCPILIWPTNDDYFAWRKRNLESDVTPPKPQPDEPKATWFDVFNLDGEVGIAAMNGGEVVAVLKSPNSLGIVDFLKRWGDHSVKHAPAGKPWPGTK